MKKSYTYLTTKQLSERLSYTPGTIRDELKDSVLIEGIHYIRPFGGRKILYLWEAIEQEMLTNTADTVAIPMARGGVCHG